MKLAGKLNAIFLLFSLIPLFLLGYLVYDYGRQGIISETFNNLELTTTLKRGEFKRWLDAHQRHLKEFAQRPLVRKYAEVLVSQNINDPAYQAVYEALETDHMEQALAEQTGFLDLSLLRGDTGLVVFSTDKKLEGQIMASEAFFHEGKKSTYVQNVTFSKESSEPVMHVNTPVNDRNGNLIAVLAAHVDWTEMSRIMMQGLEIHPSQETYLVNKSNFFVTESRFSPGFAMKRAIFTEAVQACLDHNNGQGLYDDYRGVPVLGAYQWIPDRELCIITEIDQTEALAPVLAYGRIVFTVAAVVALIVLILGYFIARRITGPLHELVRGAGHIGRGELDFRVKVKSQDEIGKLAGSFNEMAGNLQSFVRDITDRKAAEDGLKSAHAELEKKVIERTADLVTINELLSKESRERKLAQELLEGSNSLLNAINRAQSLFIADTEPHALFDELLKNLLRLTDSEYGFIGEVLYESDGVPYFKAHAITDISWNEETREFYEKNSPTGFEFRNLKTLFGHVMTSGRTVISNNPGADPRRGGLPDGHPPLNAFCGLPLFREDALIGMIGIANRPGGYDHELLSFLEPYINTCVRIIEAFRNEQRRKEAEEEIALNFRSQAVLNEILRLSLEGYSLAEILQHSLNIILSLPWLAIEAKGCIFLTEKDSDRLVMTARKDIPAGVREKCSRVSFGSCMCGRAAQDGKLLFADRVDDRHDVTYEGMEPHGHYCVPIRSGDTSIGVLNVYLKEGHVSLPAEENFLESVASTLANIIMGKKAEEQIRRSKAMLQAVFDGIPDPLVMVDRDMKIRMINKASWQYYQVNRPMEIIGRACFLDNKEMFFPGEISDAVTADPVHEEVIFERRGFMNPERFEEVAIYPVHGEGEDSHGSIIRISDITENRKMQEHLIRADRLSSLGQLSGGIAHEIRNPLAGISLFADILADEEKFVLNGQQKEIIQEIKDNINKIDEIIRRVLDFAKPPASSMSSVDVNILLQGIIKLWHSKFSKSEIQLGLSLAPAPLYVRTDPLGLQQVIHNLLMNAMEAMEAMEGGRVLEISTTRGRSLHHKGREVAFVKVKDSGPGIPPEQSAEIFNPFYTTKATGTGLGLAISHQIIEHVGGAISVQSEPGKGTVFTIELPLTEGDD